MMISSIFARISGKYFQECFFDEVSLPAKIEAIWANNHLGFIYKADSTGF